MGRMPNDQNVETGLLIRTHLKNVILLRHGLLACLPAVGKLRKSGDRRSIFSPRFNNEVQHLKVLRSSALGYADDTENLQTPVHL